LAADRARTIVVAANGHYGEKAPLLDRLHAADLVIAADGGANWLHDQGVRPDVLVGDMDSVRAQVLADCEAEGTRIERHPTGKDETDTELALHIAAAQNPQRILVFGALGGRIDHALANMALLAMPELVGVEILLVDDATTVRLCRGRCELCGRLGDTVSLIPFGGEAKGVVTQGLVYPLCGETLLFSAARGISNELAAERAEVCLTGGYLLVVHTSKREVSRGTR